MNQKPTSYVLAALGFLPAFAFAVTPILTGVLGTVQQGLTVTITGTSMVQEDQSSWVSFFQNHPVASGFEGAGTLSSMGYDTAHDADWTIDTSVKLMGTNSRRNHSSGQAIHDNATLAEHGAQFSIFGDTDMSSASATSDVWFRNYIRVDTGATGEWPHNFGGGSADFKIFGKWPGGGGPLGFWASFAVPNASPPDTPTGIRLTPTILNNFFSSGPTIVKNRWYCVEIKAPVDSNNHVWQIYVDNALVFSQDLGQGINFVGGDQWYGFFVNWYSTTSTFDQFIWTDGLAVKNNGRVRPASVVEITNSPNYATATKVYQAPEFLSDTSLQIKVNLTGLGAGPYFLWVTNNRGERSLALGLSSPTTVPAPANLRLP